MTLARKCSRDALKCILEIDNLLCDSKEVFDACITRAKNACKKAESDASVMENLENQLGECLYLIPFYLMSPKKISQIASEHGGLFDRDEMTDSMKIMASNGPIALEKFKYKGSFLLKTNASCWFNRMI